MTTLLVATRNAGKFREIRELVGDSSLSVIDLDHYPTIEVVEELGSTFAENASLKASGYARQSRELTLADDSGLMVEALNGAPGIHSARYAGEGASDAARTEKLLSAMAGLPESRRAARFVSVIAIADSNGSIINLSHGECLGRIASMPRGHRGFGYDPVFIPDGFDLTFGQLEPTLKNRISHRARALAKANVFLRALTSSSGDG